MTPDAKRVLTKLAAECHRSKWQFDLSEDYRPSKSAARALILQAFNELHRIGDLALKMREDAATVPLTPQEPVAWPVEPPSTGANYTAGLWSRRNYAAMIEDFAAVAPAPSEPPPLGTREALARAMQGANSLRMLLRLSWDEIDENEREHWLFLADTALALIPATGGENG